MSAAPELPPEVPITDARDHLAELVNQATYAGSTTYLTRHGRRVAAIVPLARAEADEAAAREAVVADLCERLWQSVQGADEDTKAQFRAAIDEILEQAEDDADAKSIAASRAERLEGVPAKSWKDLKSELGL